MSKLSNYGSSMAWGLSETNKHESIHFGMIQQLQDVDAKAPVTHACLR